ncbi:MAG: GntP family permease [Oscillospiraceae bacterium]|nr:GntP family permease [Oscillospiraceae bacterium]
MDTLSLIGCILGFVVMGYLTYIGWNIMVSSVAGALVVVLFNGLNPATAYIDYYLVGMGGFMAQYFGMMFFCAVLAVLYSESGAGLTIALGIAKICLKDSYSPKKRRHIVIVALILMSALLEFAGVGASQVVFVLYPVALSLFKIADIPKKFIVAGILGGCLGFANGLPGSPMPGNVIPMQILGTSSTAALVPGLIGAVVEIIAMAVLVNLLITKDVNNGGHFEYGPKDKEFEDLAVRPNMIITLLPMFVLVILFDIIKMDINMSLILTCIVASLLFMRYLPGKDIKSTITNGCLTALPAVVSICAVIGFATVVQSTPAFEQIVTALSTMDINPYVLLIVTICMMCMLCGGSATGQAIAVPIIGPIVHKAGLSLAAIHRISSFSGAILDTMPYAGTVVMAHAFCDVKIKDGYPSVFIISVVATAISAITVALVCALFPGLAV